MSIVAAMRSLLNCMSSVLARFSVSLICNRAAVLETRPTDLWLSHLQTR